ncbi:hypothetical protein GCM10009823_24820 [Brevibacterium salitolerans]|uniref:Uncharacterized protein n=1 Tax=Brevibacterium salitolerans TaxID=1403566 RepID=A0ABN2WYZ5_9MICO
MLGLGGITCTERLLELLVVADGGDQLTVIEGEHAQSSPLKCFFKLKQNAVPRRFIHMMAELHPRTAESSHIIRLTRPARSAHILAKEVEILLRAPRGCFPHGEYVEGSVKLCDIRDIR